ncbi:MAG: ChaN family lipoprotein [Crocinitomicaceae bacterium]|nr:ChaN family lipoprotein [Crocinitomicaceae bacterium]
MKQLFTLLGFLFFSISLIAQESKVVISKKDYVIYSSKTGKQIKPEEIIEDLKDTDVLFFGEEHNDSVGHQLQLMLFEMMFKSFADKAVISMEMFDRDVQYIMDEYLAGLTKQSYFYKDSRKWSNYKDYEPMIEFAKANGLDVICANAPFRYVNVATSKGIEGLMKLSDQAKKALAPLPYNLADGPYKDKLNAMMGHDPSKPDSKPAYDMIPGQSLWDATMAYSIYEKKKARPDAKILHLNGRFHTDEYYGIVQRLKEYDPNIKVLVISLDGSAENYPKVKVDDYKQNGDYLIFTDPSVAKSY